jgi:cytochrome c
MKFFATVTTLVTLIAAPSFAGDAVAGAALFSECRTCHMVRSPSGELLEQGGRVGPNLFGLSGRQAGGDAGFAYSVGLSAAGNAGLTWSEATFTSYLADSNGYLQQYTGNSAMRSGMNFQLTTGAEDIFAYLESLGS